MRARVCTGCRIANAHCSRPKSFRSLGSPLIPDTDAALSSLNRIIRAFNKEGEGGSNSFAGAQFRERLWKAVVGLEKLFL